MSEQHSSGFYPGAQRIIAISLIDKMISRQLAG
jgi:hypothetical protein